MQQKLIHQTRRLCLARQAEEWPNHRTECPLEKPCSVSPLMHRKSPASRKAANATIDGFFFLSKGRKNTYTLFVNSWKKGDKIPGKYILIKKKKKVWILVILFNWVGRGYFIMQQIRKFIIYHCTQSKCHPTESHPCENHHIVANCQACCSRRAKLICKYMQEIKKQNYPGK